MSINWTLVEKLLNLALDGAAAPGEIENSGRMLIKHLRQAGIKYKDLFTTTVKTVYVDKPVYVDRVVYKDRVVDKIVYVDATTKKAVPLMTFGKYKGMPVTDIADKDPNYLYWVLENCDKIGPTLQKTICKLLDVELVNENTNK